MKTVFKSDEIAHIWANRGAPYGRSPGNLSFDGDAIKSYATVIGRRIEHKGKTAFVLDRASFSVTTTRAQYRAWSAIPDSEKVFHVRIGQRGQSLRFTPAELAEHYEKHAENMAGELPSRYAKIRAQQWQAVTAELEKARDVLAFFGYGTARLDNKIASRKAGDATAAETLLKDREKREAARIKREAKDKADRIARDIKGATDFLAGVRPKTRVDLTYRQSALETLEPDLRARFVAAVAEHNAAIDAAEAKDAAEKIAEWRAGTLTELPCNIDCPVMLRAEAADKDAAEMVTSKGARVPLDDAHKTYRFACLMRAKGWHKNGETHAIGAYQLDAVNENGVVAGCHRVTWAEIERFAAAQGWAS